MYTNCHYQHIKTGKEVKSILQCIYIWPKKVATQMSVHFGNHQQKFVFLQKICFDCKKAQVDYLYRQLSTLQSLSPLVSMPPSLLTFHPFA